MTATATWTVSVARQELLYANVAIALRRAKVASSDRIARYINPGLTNRWLSGFHIMGLDSNGLRCAELLLRISWGAHDAYLARGELRVVAHDTWRDEAISELDVLEGLFLDAVDDLQLTCETHFEYSDFVYQTPGMRQLVERELGLQPAPPPPEWAAEPVRAEKVSHAVGEMTLGIGIAGR